MIETQRAYEVNSKAISSADGMLRFLNQNLRRIDDAASSFFVALALRLCQHAAGLELI